MDIVENGFVAKFLGQTLHVINILTCHERLLCSELKFGAYMAWGRVFCKGESLPQEYFLVTKGNAFCALFRAQHKICHTFSG